MVHPTIVGLIIQNPPEKGIAVRTTNPLDRTQVREKVVGQQYFYFEPHVGFIRLLFAKTEVTNTCLARVILVLERLSAPLMHRALFLTLSKMSLYQALSEGSLPDKQF